MRTPARQGPSADRLRLCPQVTIVIKYFFQFGFFPFNQKLEVDRSKPFHPPNILGVEKKEGYVLYDLLQLLALFYHRAILKVRTNAATCHSRSSRGSSSTAARAVGPDRCHGDGRRPGPPGRLRPPRQAGRFIGQGRAPPGQEAHAVQQQPAALSGR